jgi:hypothetical protein
MKCGKLLDASRLPHLDRTARVWLETKFQPLQRQNICVCLWQ